LPKGHNGTPLKTYDLANNETDYTYTGTYSDGSCNHPFPTNIKNISTGLSTSYTYDCTGGVMLTAVDASGNMTIFGYDSSGGTPDPWWRLRSVTDPLNNETWLTPTATSYERSQQISSGSIQNVVTTFDGYGRTINMQRQQSPSVSNYDTTSILRNFSSVQPTVFISNPCSQILGSFCSTYGPTNAYDMLERIVSSVQSGSNATDTITYPQNDTLAVLSPAPSPENNKQVQAQYDGLGRPTSVCAISTTVSGTVSCGQNTNTSATGVLTTTMYSSATGSRTVSSTRGLQTHSKTVDGLGRATIITTPESGTAYYTYDTDSTCGTSTGDLVKKVDANGNTSCYSYDSLHRIITVMVYTSGVCKPPVKRFRYDSTTNGILVLPGGYPTSNTNTSGRMIEAWTGDCV
jgi:YD repeat-containing protein